MSTLNLSDAMTDALRRRDWERTRELWAEMESWLSGDVQKYKPTLTADTTDPTLGSNAQQYGMYRVLAGNLVIGWFAIIFGTSGTAQGSGNYYVSLPFKGDILPYGFSTVGSGRLRDASNSYSYLVTMELVAGAKARMIWDKQSAGTGSAVDAVDPFTFSASDELHGSFMYVAKDLVI